MAETTDAGIDVQHETARQRFVVQIDGKEGTLDYRRRDDQTLDFRSTYVPRELRGRKLGERLVLYGLDYAREQGLKVVPTCPYVGRVVEDHPEYRDLITG